MAHVPYSGNILMIGYGSVGRCTMPQAKEGQMPAFTMFVQPGKVGSRIARASC